ncbi:VOC family protein [Actinoplanes sp. NPDC049802]|uniref:VOC family protein n=1 Tax=Actinoplanes sp. NPDC049802 TaxID=3154742 RepID=UPI0033DA5FE5
MLKLENITFDCPDAAELAGFWSRALDRPVDDGADGFHATIKATDSGPTLMFLQVGESKAAKNRCHLDLSSDDREAEVKRLLDLGATHEADHHEYGIRWTVLRDPAGNEFCVAGV